MKRVRLLLDSGITPIIVFDGANLPMKSLTEQNRKESRISRKSKGLEYLKLGDRTKAIECFQTCIDVTPLMAFEFIKALKAANIEFIVAPYEADAQLTFLNLSGYISAVLTEDSDLISFGCTKVLYKLRPDGYCIEILKESLGNIKEMRFWSSERFRQMCILSGCDYLNSIPGIGVKTAMKHLEKTDAYSLMKSWKTWGSTIKAPKMPPNYLESFLLADQTFQFQRVYDPKKGKLVTLNPIPSHVKITPELMHAIGP
jgi:exonuclease-1